MSADPKTGEDLTGRRRFARNLSFAWGGYMVNVIAGFIMPRMISDHLGQASLGIWDFAWSVVTYFSLVQLGLGGSVNRYVARYRAVKDSDGLSRSVSTVGLFLKLAGGMVLVATVATSVWVLPLFQGQLGEQLAVSRWVVLFLGAEVGVSIMFTVYGAVIVGCHRWDTYNTLSAICYGTTTVAMIVALLAGGGLATVAFVHFAISAACDLIRIRLAFRACPELRINYRGASWSVFKEQARYSAKILVPYLGVLLSQQTASVLITAFLGPAALAVFSRPRSLLGSVRALANKFGMLLVPTASSLQATDDHAALRVTLIDSTFWISCFAWPVVIALTIFGDSVIRIWMGSDYVCPGLVEIIVLGSFGTIVQEPIWSVLSGLNCHGRLGLLKLGGGVAAAVFLVVQLAVLKGNLLGAALALAIPQIALDLIVTPVYACRVLGISISAFYGRAILKPLLCAAPYAGCLILARLVLKQQPWLAVLIVVGAVMVLVGVYWMAILPEDFRRKIVGKLMRLLPARKRPATG